MTLRTDPPKRCTALGDALLREACYAVVAAAVTATAVAA
eukprot:CAMPEP_0183340038 /NCGR_PEP_ID=MMETSP0164_2-20130417/6730_1 /TAXON_ID=221442 /ORGANISM="Coccolithus pelagicus ssp braarudi, Strain PLY182g" /LENGTH=38 /DNA_ID= /DNA_START= /DNA_END= /DNA_ORIENTATION=